MVIINIPFHHWRKIEKEGTRTRDAHIIEKLSVNAEVDKLIILNRPISLLEIALKGFNTRINGKVIFRKRNYFLYQLSEKKYVVDHISSDLLGPIFLKKRWFFKAYGNKNFYSFFEQSCKELGVDKVNVISHSVYSVNFIARMKGNIIFDAYDNLIKFPSSKKMKTQILLAYEKLSKLANVWTTNSIRNSDFYVKNYNPKKVVLIKNGVDPYLFEKTYPCPNELSKLSKPIIGFGGKINHLFDVELFNFVTQLNPDKSFIVIGQIMDQNIFDSITKRANVFYFGDKPYDEYCSFVKYFDVGIIPYRTDDNSEHGGDSIKAYEYIASGIRVIGTNGNGLDALSDYIQVVENKDQFNVLLQSYHNIPLPENLSVDHFWESKAKEFLEWV